MIPELGHLALILALCLALVQSSLPLVGAWRGDRQWMSLARPAAWGQFAFLAFAFGCLTWAFLRDDFSVAYVAGNSNSALPWYYKFSAVWGAHEGSLLLWALILGGWTFAVSIFSRQLPEVMLARVLAVMGMISTGFLLFLIITSNPFSRLLPQTLMDGNDLNPLLQDVGLIVHPPMLYMGYVGFSVAFAFAIAALLGGRLDAAWARWSRPWTLVAWAFLGIGIVLGSWWAYYELGWGLVVLGSGGKRLLHALAGRHCTDPLAGGDREARRVQELDRAAGDRRFLPEPAGHLPGPLRRAHLGARLRLRPGARGVHPRLPAAGGRRLADPVRPARAGGQEPGRLRPVVARDPAAAEQPGAGGGGLDDPPRDPLPAAARCPQRRQAVGRPAVLQRHVPAADGGADGGAGGRRAGALEGHPEPLAARHADPGAGGQRGPGGGRFDVLRRFQLGGAGGVPAVRLGGPGRFPRLPRQDPAQGRAGRRPQPDPQLLGHATGAPGHRRVRHRHRPQQPVQRPA